MAYHQNPDAFTVPILTKEFEFSSWTALDLSSVVGKQSVLVQLKFDSDDDVTAGIVVRTTGSTKDQALVNTRLRGVTRADINGDIDGLYFPSRLWCLTDANGSIDIKGGKSATSGKFWKLYVVGWLDVTVVDLLATGDYVDTYMQWRTGSYTGDFSGIIGSDKSGVLTYSEHNGRDVDTTYSTPLLLITPNGLSGHHDFDPLQAASSDYPKGPALVGDVYYAGGGDDGPGWAIVPMGADVKFRYSCKGSNDRWVRSWINAYVDTDEYITNRVILRYEGTVPTSWSTLDLTQDALGNPTGISGRCFVYLRVRRNTYGSIYAEMISFRNSDDQDDYYTRDFNTRRGAASGQNVCTLEHDRDCFVCLETDDEGKVQWRAGISHFGGSTGTGVEAQIDLEGYIQGIPIPTVSEFSADLELGTPPIIEGSDLQADLQLGMIYPRIGTHTPYVINKVWHGPTTQWVRWMTADPDTTGQHYPGPGSFGECTDFMIEAETYQPLPGVE